MEIVESGRFPSRAALIRALGPGLGAELASQAVRHWDPQGYPFAPAPGPTADREVPCPLIANPTSPPLAASYGWVMAPPGPVPAG